MSSCHAAALGSSPAEIGNPNATLAHERRDHMTRQRDRRGPEQPGPALQDRIANREHQHLPRDPVRRHEDARHKCAHRVVAEVDQIRRGPLQDISVPPERPIEEEPL
jgi:hypothetical protein